MFDHAAQFQGRPDRAWLTPALTGLALALGLGLIPPGRAQMGPSIPIPGQDSSVPWGVRMGPSDQRFMVMMVPHHDGAIAMADLALTRARRAEIKQLASQIKASQSRENDQMRRWYRQWYGTELPSWGPGMGWGWHHGGMMGGLGMPGMGRWGGTNLAALRQAADFDRVFLEQMIPHHQMGVMMASMELNSTQRPEMRKLAEAMVRVQSEEIDKMQRWYQAWYP